VPKTEIGPTTRSGSMRNFKVIIFEIFVQNSLLIKKVPEIYTFFIDFNEKSAVLFDKNILITQKLIYLNFDKNNAGSFGIY